MGVATENYEIAAKEFEKLNKQCKYQIVVCISRRLDRPRSFARGLFTSKGPVQI